MKMSRSGAFVCTLFWGRRGYYGAGNVILDAGALSNIACTVLCSGSANCNSYHWYLSPDGTENCLLKDGLHLVEGTPNDFGNLKWDSRVFFSVNERIFYDTREIVGVTRGLNVAILDSVTKNKLKSWYLMYAFRNH